jgi:hypothetical protein
VNEPERLAGLEKAALRCLELLDEGRVDEARRELAAAIGPVRGSGALAPEVTDLELDHAFERAQPVADEVIDADRVAHQAIREVDRELLGDRGVPPAAFATSTMAELLERQGDLDGARRIRDSLARRGSRSETRPGGGRRPERARVVATLERWLANVRREE